MRIRRFLFTGILVACLGCQIEEDNAPGPDDSYVRYYGESIASYEAKDLDVVFDQTGQTAVGLVVFGTIEKAGRDDKYFIMETDLNGNLIDSASFDFAAFRQLDFDQDGNITLPNEATVEIEADSLLIDEEAVELVILENGGYAVIGNAQVDNTLLDETIADYTYVQIGIISSIEAGAAVINGFAAFHADTTVLVDFENDLIGTDLIEVSDGSLAFTGSREKTGVGFSETDGIFVKLSADLSTTIFRRGLGVEGSGENDRFVKVFENDDQSFAVIGDAFIPSGIDPSTESNRNIGFFNYSSEGVLDDPTSIYGLNDSENLSPVLNDVVTNAIATVQGGYAIVGSSFQGNNQLVGGFLVLVGRSGNLQNKRLIFSERSASRQVALNAAAQTSNNDYVLVGSYESFSVDGQNRGQEGFFFRTDQSGNSLGLETNFGLSTGNDETVDAIMLPEGKVVVLSNMNFGGGVQLISLIKLNEDGSIDN